MLGGSIGEDEVRETSPPASFGPDRDTATAASYSAVMTYFQAVFCPFEALSQYRPENENLAIGSAPLNSM